MTNPTAPSEIPATYPPGGIAWKIWRSLECRARGTLLVHGSHALRHLQNCGQTCDVKAIITDMVEAGILKPCKVDFAGVPAEYSIAFYGKNLKHIQQSAWCTDYALLWTYEPVNRVPMREWFE